MAPLGGRIWFRNALNRPLTPRPSPLGGIWFRNDLNRPLTPGPSPLGGRIWFRNDLKPGERGAPTLPRRGGRGCPLPWTMTVGISAIFPQGRGSG